MPGAYLPTYSAFFLFPFFGDFFSVSGYKEIIIYPQAAIRSVDTLVTSLYIGLALDPSRI